MGFLGLMGFGGGATGASLAGGAGVTSGGVMLTPGGGGGGGGVRQTTGATFPAGTYSVTVGAGGNPAPATGRNPNGMPQFAGGYSQIGPQPSYGRAVGGGFGGQTSVAQGGSGGSGGGGQDGPGGGGAGHPSSGAAGAGAGAGGYRTSFPGGEKLCMDMMVMMVIMVLEQTFAAVVALVDQVVAVKVDHLMVDLEEKLEQQVLILFGQNLR